MHLQPGVDERATAAAMSGPQRLLPPLPLPVLPPTSLEHGHLHDDEYRHMPVKPHKVIIHRWGQKLFDKHRGVLDTHKQKGGPFARAVENLEKTFSSTTE